MKKCFRTILLVIVAMVLIGCCKSVNSYNIEPLSIPTATFSIEPDNLIYFEDMGLPNFTCTGFAYDSVNDTYWIGNHGTQLGDSIQLVQIDSDMNSVISFVQIEGYFNDGKINLQGIAYDSLDDALWCAIGDSIVEITKDGTVKNNFTNYYFKKYQANGISIDPIDSSIWVLCYSTKLIHIDRNGNIIGDFTINYKDQDMIFVDDSNIWITIGADYIGKNNFLAVFDKESLQLIVDYRLIKSYAIEGIYKKDGYCYIVNDGLYHESTIPKSYISIYKLN